MKSNYKRCSNKLILLFTALFVFSQYITLIQAKTTGESSTTTPTIGASSLEGPKTDGKKDEK